MSEAPPSTSFPPHPAHVLSAYLEPVARGRRVAVLGDATLGLAERLLSRGARSVHVYDVDGGRVAEALAKSGGAQRPQAAPSFTALQGEHGLREGAYDLVVVPDLSSLGAPEEVAQRARRLLASSAGAAVFASPNPESERWLLPGGAEGAPSAAGYYELYDAVSAHFAEVRMLGQAPFVGYALVDFSVEEPEVSIDTSSLDEPELPEWYVAVASDRPLSLEAYALVELPLEDVAGAGELQRSGAEPVTLPGGRTREAGARATIDEQAVALSEARARISVLTTEIERLREESTRHARLVRAKDELVLKLAELEKELESARVRARDAELKLADEKSRAGELGAEILRLEDELSRQRSRVARDREVPGVAAELATAKARLVKLEAELDEVEAERDAILARADELEAKLGEVEPPTLRSRESALKLAALEAKLGEVEAKLAEALEASRAQGQRAAEADKRASDAEKRAEKAERELAAAHTVKAEALRQAKDSDAKCAATAKRVEELEAQLAAAQAAREAAEASAAELASKAKAAPREQELVEAHAAEVEELEAALRASGLRVAELGRELREAERVGRELLFELEAARLLPAQGAPAAPAPANGGASGTRGSSSGPNPPSAAASAALEELAERAARAEADLMASSWKVSQLERTLAQRAAEAAQPADARLGLLERALVLAQREIAELRAAGPGGADRAVLEQAVLLEQAERRAPDAERAG